jgi:hypothetical protein
MSGDWAVLSCEIYVKSAVVNQYCVVFLLSAYLVWKVPCCNVMSLFELFHFHTGLLVLGVIRFGVEYSNVLRCLVLKHMVGDKQVLVLHLSTLKLKFPQCLHIPYFKNFQLNIDLYTYINDV